MSQTKNTSTETSAGPNHAYLQLSRMMREGRSWSGRERNCCFLGTRGGTFSDVSAISGLDFPDDSRALAVGDWDGDGDPDLWVSNRNAPRLRFLRNDAAPPGSFLNLRLRGDGKKTNLDAVGARVELRLASDGKRPLLRTVTAGDGFLTQSSRWLAFAVRNGAGISEVKVSWPAGKTELFSGVRAGGRYELRQGSGRAKPVNIDQPPPPASSTPLLPPPASDRARIRLITLLDIPDLAFLDLEGQRSPLLPGRGRPLLVNLWASWCVPCLEELREFRERGDELKKAGIEILALSTDELDKKGSIELPERVKKFIGSLGPPIRTGRATGDLVAFLQNLHDSMVPLNKPLPLPSSFLIDSAGRLSVIYKGPLSVDDLIEDIGHGRLERKERLLAGALLPGISIESQAIKVAAIEAEAALRFQYGLNLDRLRLGPAALKQYQAVLSMKPEFTEAENNLGLLHLRAGRLAKAESSFRRAISLREEYVEPRFNLGAVYDRQGQLDKAIALYLDVLRRRPDYERANNSLGIIRARQGKRALAARRFEKEIEVNPRFAEAHNNLGQLLLEVKQDQAAETRLREAVRLDPLDPQAQMNLAIALKRNGKTKAALEHYLEAIRLQPRFVEAINNLGRLYLDEGRLEEAKASFRRALEINPGFTPARVNLERALGNP